jgi:hypothetical protein
MDLLDETGGRKKREPIKRWVIVLMVIIASLTMWSAFVLSIWKIRTILFTGPAVLIVAAILLIPALLNRNGFAVLLAVLCLFTVLLVLGVILIYDLSPGQAEGPVPWLILFMSMLTTGVSALSIWKVIKHNKLS